MGKVKLRDQHYREKRDILGYDAVTELPIYGPWYSEPLIVAWRDPREHL